MSTINNAGGTTASANLTSADTVENVAEVLAAVLGAVASVAKAAKDAGEAGATRATYPTLAELGLPSPRNVGDGEALSDLMWREFEKWLASLRKGELASEFMAKLNELSAFRHFLIDIEETNELLAARQVEREDLRTSIEDMEVDRAEMVAMSEALADQIEEYEPGSPERDELENQKTLIDGQIALQDEALAAAAVSLSALDSKIAALELFIGLSDTDRATVLSAILAKSETEVSDPISDRRWEMMDESLDALVDLMMKRSFIAEDFASIEAMQNHALDEEMASKASLVLAPALIMDVFAGALAAGGLPEARDRDRDAGGRIKVQA